MHCGLAAAIIAHGGGGAPHATLSDGGLHRTPASRPIGASSAVQAPCERLRMGSTLQEAEASALARKRPGAHLRSAMMYALYFEKLPSRMTTIWVCPSRRGSVPGRASFPAFLLSTFPLNFKQEKDSDTLWMHSQSQAV